MRKPAFYIFYGLCILEPFSLLIITVRGLSDKYYLLTFFISLYIKLKRLIIRQSDLGFLLSFHFVPDSALGLLFCI